MHVNNLLTKATLKMNDKSEEIMKEAMKLYDNFLADRQVKPVTVNGTIGLSKSYPVEVKAAGNKGLGVFATRNIRRGEVCCYYDGLLTTGIVKGVMTTGKHGFNQAFIFNGQDCVLAGFAQQFRVGGCAQLCNDASTTYTDAGDLKYLKNINVTDKNINEMGLAFVATKRIKKGEELLYSYGPEYWQIHHERRDKGWSDDVKTMWDSSMNIIKDKGSEDDQRFLRNKYDCSNHSNIAEYCVRCVLVDTLANMQQQ